MCRRRCGNSGTPSSQSRPCWQQLRRAPSAGGQQATDPVADVFAAEIAAAAVRQVVPKLMHTCRLPGQRSQGSRRTKPTVIQHATTSSSSSSSDSLLVAASTAAGAAAGSTSTHHHRRCCALLTLILGTEWRRSALATNCQGAFANETEPSRFSARVMLRSAFIASVVAPVLPAASLAADM
jgi:hypothetical protein